MVFNFLYITTFIVKSLFAFRTTMTRNGLLDLCRWWTVRNCQILVNATYQQREARAFGASAVGDPGGLDIRGPALRLDGLLFYFLSS